MKVRWALLAWLAACGLQEVELARRPLGDDVLVLDGVSEQRVARFAIAGEAKQEPKLALAYPPGGAAIPSNVAPFTFVWERAKMQPPREPPPPAPKPGPAMDVVFELHLRCAAAELRVYLAAGELTVPAEHWRRLLEGNQGSTLEVALRALDGKGALKAAPPLTLEVRAPTAPGALYYVAEAQGLARAELAEPGFRLVSQETTCAGCRPIARDGSVRLVESEPEVVVEALASGARTTLTSAAPLPALDWASFSPDGLRLVASGRGQLAHYASDPLGFELAGLGYAADPDWSPSGALLALAADTRAPGMMMMTAMEPAPNAIARVTIDGGSAGALELLVESDAPDETLRAPSFSPDGRFVAFTRQKGKGDQSGLAWVDAQAESAGQAARGELLQVKAREALPTWLPSSVEREYWLIFSSSQEGPRGKPAPEQVQLWALGAERLPDDSLQPLGEPFWLPCQDSTTSNRRALFAPR